MTDFLDYLPIIFGLSIGLPFGLLVASSRFCLLGAISDILLFRYASRALFWAIAAVSALAGVSLLRYLNILNLSDTHYLMTPVTPLPAIIGGSLFGIGMVLATGCLVKNIVRMASGCLKSLIVVLLTALSAHMVFSGPLAPLRSWLYRTLPVFSNSQIADTRYLVILAFLLLGILFWAGLKKTSEPATFWIKAVILGSLIWIAFSATTWVISQQLHTDSLSVLLTDTALVPESLTFVKPVVQVLDWILWAKPALDFGLGILIGTISGACLYYGRKRQIALSGFSNACDLRNHLIGAILMGIGAAIAGGCTVGQGLSGFSTGSIHALITLVFILLSASLLLVYIDKKS